MTEAHEDVVLEIATLLRTFVGGGGLAWDDFASGVALVLAPDIAAALQSDGYVNMRSAALENTICSAARGAMDKPEVRRILRAWMANTMVTAAEDMT